MFAPGERTKDSPRRRNKTIVCNQAQNDGAANG
jgi:hypothetical protein